MFPARIADIAASAIKALERGLMHESCIAVTYAADRFRCYHIFYGSCPATEAWRKFNEDAAGEMPEFWGADESFLDERIDRLKVWAALHGDEEIKLDA